MLGLEGYASDDSEDDKSAEERQPSSTLRNTLPEGAAGPSSRTVALPDAESLFSSSAAASMPWQGYTQQKRAAPQAQMPAAKTQKRARFTTPAGQQQTVRNRQTPSALLPPQLRGRANASTEDLDRIGLKRVNKEPSKQ